MTIVDHIPCLNAAATLCLLGRVAPIPIVERCLDEFTRTNSIRWLTDTLERLSAPNCRGTTRLSKVLNDPRRTAGRTESWFERVVADLLARKDLPPLELQYPVTVNSDRYRIDVAIPSVRLGIEAHSRTYHWGPEAADADNRRDLALSGAGWQLLYVTWTQLDEPTIFVEQVARAVAARRTMFAGENSQPRPEPPANAP